MATKQDVSFGNPATLIAPDLAVAQQQIARKQAIIDAMRSQSLSPIDAGRGSVSWTQGLAKMLDAYAANSMQKRNDAQAIDINRQYASRLAPMFGGSAPAPSGPNPYAPTPAPSPSPSPQPPTADNGPLPAMPPVNPSPAASSPQDAPPVTPSLPTGQPPAPAAAAMPSAAPSYPMALTGNPQQDMGYYIMDPEDYTKAVITARAPTDFTRLLAQSGIDPNSPIGRRLMQEQVFKQNYVAPVNARAGSYTTDPATGRTVYHPQLSPDSEPVYDGAGNIVGVKTLDGAIQVIHDVEKAKASGKGEGENPYTPVQVYNPQTGNYDWRPRSDILSGNGANPPPAPVAGGATGGSLNTYYGKAANTGPAVAAPGPSGQSSGQAAGTNSANAFQSAIDAGASAKDASFQIDRMMQNWQKVPTGHGADVISDVKSAGNAISGAAGFGPIFNTSTIASFDQIRKGAAALGMQLSKASGQTSTDARLQNALDALPSAHYSPQARYEVQLNLKGLWASAQARGQAAALWQQTHGNDSYPAFARTWQQNYDPELFYQYAQGPQQFQKWAQTLNAQQRSAMLEKYRALKSMGAF